MRIAKNGDVRKQELLDAALQLFYEKGYEKTTVRDIFARVGVSKGAFYYYFDSKDDVLEAVARQCVEKPIKIIEDTAAQKNLNALEKCNLLIQRLQQYKAANKNHLTKVNSLFNNTDNLKLVRRIIDHTTSLAIKPYKKIIEQGIAENIFNINFVDETTELLLHLFYNMNYSLSAYLLELNQKPKNKSIVERKLFFYEDVINRLLGIEKGSINLAQPVLEAFFNEKSSGEDIK